MMNRFLHNVCVIIAMILITIAIIVCVAIPLLQEYKCNFGLSPNVIACIATIANALLLYATLNSQNKSSEQKHFETTFFKMIKQRKQIIEELYVVSNVYKEQVERKCWRQHDTFSFAKEEKQKIEKALNYDHYVGIYDDDVDEPKWGQFYQSEYDNPNNDPDEEIYKQYKMKEYEEFLEIKFINLIYRISSDKYDKYQKMEDKERRNYPFKIFILTWFHVYERYIKSIKIIFKYLSNNNVEDLSIYADFIEVEMSQDEQNFVRDCVSVSSDMLFKSNYMNLNIKNKK